MPISEEFHSLERCILLTQTGNIFSYSELFSPHWKYMAQTSASASFLHPTRMWSLQKTSLQRASSSIFSRAALVGPVLWGMDFPMLEWRSLPDSSLPRLRILVESKARYWGLNAWDRRPSPASLFGTGRFEAARCFSWLWGSHHPSCSVRAAVHSRSNGAGVQAVTWGAPWVSPPDTLVPVTAAMAFIRTVP